MKQKKDQNQQLWARETIYWLGKALTELSAYEIPAARASWHKFENARLHLGNLRGEDEDLVRAGINQFKNHLEPLITLFSQEQLKNIEEYE